MYYIDIYIDMYYIDIYIDMYYIDTDPVFQKTTL